MSCQDRFPAPSGRRRHRGRGLFRPLALAVVPASVLVAGMMAAGAASASTASPALPAAVAAPAVVAAPAAAPTGDGYGPASLQSAYKLPSATAGTGQTVAIVTAFDDPTAAADLAAYRAAWGQPACVTATGAGCLTVVNQNGASSPLPAAPPAGDDWTLNTSASVDMVSAICPNCHIKLYEATGDSGEGMYVAVDSAASLAKFVDTSFESVPAVSDQSLDAEYFNHPGVVITASAGDGGFDDGSGDSYPAASPDVVAVGGTTLRAASNSRGWTETAWAGTGSGCTPSAAKPAWQTDTGCYHRSSNDIAAVADPSTPVAVYDSSNGNGGWMPEGGTAVASAIIAATFALAGAPAAGTWPASYLYAQAANLFDVTSGSTGSCSPAYLCTAGTGYDGPTGLGTPDGVAAFTAPATWFASGASKLTAGQKVTSGQYLASPNGQYTLTVQAGGNVVVSGNGCTIWSSGTTGAGNYLTMQTDGNLVVYSSAGKALWASNTTGTGAADYLSLQNDGNAIVYTSAAKNVWAAGRANASRLCPGGILDAGQALYSPSEKYQLTMQTDGNLVAYDGTAAIWASNTKGTGSADYLYMQTDGNLVVYTSAGGARWSSNTYGTGSANYLVMQDDGNVVVYTSAGRAVWTSGTTGK